MLEFGLISNNAGLRQECDTSGLWSLQVLQELRSTPLFLKLRSDLFLLSVYE